MAINKRTSLLALTILLTALGGVLIGAITFGGGGKQTVASRSAAAFREAQRKGEPVAEGAHGHGAVSPGGGHAGMEMPGQGKTAMPGHAGMEMPSQGKTAMPGHAGMEMPGQGKTAMPGHAGMEMPGQGKTAMPGHAGMEMPGQGKTAMPGHAGMEMPGQGKTAMPGHAGMEMPGQGKTAMPGHAMAGGAALEPLAKAAVARPGQPAATLEPDPLDAPAATSQMDAKRSAEMAAEMEAGGHGMQHGMTSYRQLDAGRDSVTTGQEEGRVAPRSPTSPDHSGMQHGSPSAPPKAPAVRKPPPSKATPGTPPPAPTHPPHHSGIHNAGAQDGEVLR